MIDVEELLSNGCAECGSDNLSEEGCDLVCNDCLTYVCLYGGSR